MTWMKNSLCNLPNFGTENRNNAFNWGFVLRVECRRRDRAGMAVTAQQLGKRGREEAHALARREHAQRERERERWWVAARFQGLRARGKRKKTSWWREDSGGLKLLLLLLLTAKDLKKCGMFRLNLQYKGWWTQLFLESQQSPQKIYISWELLELDWISETQRQLCVFFHPPYSHGIGFWYKQLSSLEEWCSLLQIFFSCEFLMMGWF